MKGDFYYNDQLVVSKNNFHNPNRYNALDAAIAFISFLLAFVILDEVLSSIIRYVYYNVYQDYALIMCLSALISQGIIALIAFIFSKIRRVGLISGGGYVFKFDFLNILFALMLAFGVYFLFESTHYEFVNCWTQVIYLTDYNSLNNDTATLLADSNVFFLLIYAYVLVPILPAFCEEILFRGVIMRGLEQFGKVFAIIGSSLIFALMHGGYEQLILQFIVGLVISSVVMLTDNLFIGCAVHFCYNLGTSVFSVYSSIINSAMPMFDYVYKSITIILGVVLIIVAIIYFGNMGLARYKRNVLGKPKTVPYDHYFILKLTDTDKMTAHLYGELTNDFYTKGSPYHFYNGKVFRPFNKYAKTVPAIIILAVGVVVSIVKIIMSA